MYVCYCTYVMHVWLHAVYMHAARMHAVRVRMHSVNSSVNECKSAHALNERVPTAPGKTLWQKQPTCLMQCVP